MKRFNEQFPVVTVNTALGTTKAIRFQSTLDCEGEVVIGKLYTIGNDTPVKTVTDGSVLGVKKNASIALNIDVSSVDVGSYGLKLYTAETGVIAKTIVVIK